MSILRSLIIAAAALVACAPPAAHRLPTAARPARLAEVRLPLAARAARFEEAPPPLAARASFQPGLGDAVLAHAVKVLADGGYEVGRCDGTLGALATERVELDVACPGGSCLARQTVEVKLGYRTAKVVVRRELWERSVGRWTEVEDAALREGLLSDEAVLAARIVDLPQHQRAGRHARPADPCRALAACDIGVCASLAPVARD